MKKVEVIVRTTEDNFPPQEKVVLKFTEQTVSSAENDTVLSYPGLEIHLEHHRVFKNGQEVYMSRYEYGVLSLMARHPGQLFTKEQIFEAVWHQDSESCLTAVTNAIGRIRQKIEDDSTRLYPNDFQPWLPIHADCFRRIRRKRFLITIKAILKGQFRPWVWLLSL